MLRRVGAPAAAVALLVMLAGCGMLFGGDDAGATGAETETTVTPAPVPADAERSTTERNLNLSGTTGGNVPDGWPGATATAQPRYLELRPTCTRPPGLVVHIQVMALANDDPATHEGINTTWQFAAPSNRVATGPYEDFVDLVTERYRPLLNATAVRYGPLERTGDRATRRVTVFDRDGTATTYRWTVERQSTPPHEGCWMTTSVSTVERRDGEKEGR